MVIKTGDVSSPQYIVQLLELYMVRAGQALSLFVGNLQHTNLYVSIANTTGIVTVLPEMEPVDPRGSSVTRSEKMNSWLREGERKAMSIFAKN